MFWDNCCRQYLLVRYSNTSKATPTNQYWHVCRKIANSYLLWPDRTVNVNIGAVSFCYEHLWVIHPDSTKWKSLSLGIVGVLSKKLSYWWSLINLTSEFTLCIAIFFTVASLGPSPRLMVLIFHVGLTSNCSDNMAIECMTNLFLNWPWVLSVYIFIFYACSFRFQKLVYKKTTEVFLGHLVLLIITWHNV